jgi:hypothetical protein
LPTIALIDILPGVHNKGGQGDRLRGHSPLDQGAYLREVLSMKAAWSMVSGLTVVFVLALGLQAQEKKEVTLKGTLMCPKCELKDKDYKDCGNALQVKKDGKTETYYLDDKGKAEKYHACMKPKENVTVTGVVSEKNGKKVVKVTKIDTGDDKK